MGNGEGGGEPRAGSVQEGGSLHTSLTASVAGKDLETHCRQAAAGPRPGKPRAIGRRHWWSGKAGARSPRSVPPPAPCLRPSLTPVGWAWGPNLLSGVRTSNSPWFGERRCSWDKQRSHLRMTGCLRKDNEKQKMFCFLKNHVWSTPSVPGPVLSKWHRLIHLILSTALPGRLFPPHFQMGN